MTRALVVSCLAIAMAACQRAEESTANAMTGGNARAGRDAIRMTGCGACHVIPGVAGAVGLVGPSLEGMALRIYVAGHLPNTPQNLMTWIRQPRHVDPKTAMPAVAASEEQVRDIAAYLYTLR
jgi:cytochrome c